MPNVLNFDVTISWLKGTNGHLNLVIFDLNINTVGTHLYSHTSLIELTKHTIIMGIHMHVYYMESYIQNFGAIPVELKVSVYWRITEVATIQNFN